MSLPRPKFVISDAKLRQLSPATLAYLGDAVYELYVRTYHLDPPKRLQDHHRRVVHQVRAESQSRHLQLISPYLTENELEIVRRGRNAASKAPKRIEPVVYQNATSFEALIGYLYLTDQDRLDELLGTLCLDGTAEDFS